MYTNTCLLGGGAKFCSKSGLVAAVINAYLCGYSIDKLNRFCEVLSTGISSGDDEIVILKLRDYIISNAVGHNGAGAMMNFYYRTQSALKNYELRKIVMKIRESSTEHYKYPKRERN